MPRFIGGDVLARAARAAGRASARALRVTLVVSVLTASTPAAPHVLADAVSEWKAGAAVWWRTSTLLADLGGLVAAQRSARPRQETQDERDARVRRVKVYPGDVTVRLGESVVFSAVAYDGDDSPVGGVTFAWSASDGGRGGGRYARISRRGEFEADAPGTYEVTADVYGNKEQVTVTVLDARRPKPRGGRPLHVYNVSSRDAAPESEGASRPARGQAKRRGARGVRIVKSSFAVPAHAAPALEPNCGDDYGWNRCNYMWGDDPGNRRGDRPGAPVDQGAGNGNFQIDAPLLSLDGRGLGVTLGLAYNSRVWAKNGTKINYDIDRDWPAAGWSLGFGKVVGLGLDKGAMLVEADGTRHAFSGSVSLFSNGSIATLHTADGTFIDYTAETNNAGVIVGATARYPNGTVAFYNVRGEGAVYPSSITDANGNFINITYVGNAGPRIETITDTLERKVIFHYDANNLLTAIVGPGLDGATRPLVRLHYAQLPALNTSFVGLTPVVRSSTPWALDAIYYPATGTGYWFGDSDSYSPYGMIRKVVEQRGMGFSATSPDVQGSVTQGFMSRQQVYDFQLTNLTDAPTFTSLTESHDGMDTASPAVTTFQAFQNSAPRTVTVTLPDGAQSVQYSYNHPGSYDDGMVYRDETKDSSGNVLRSSDVVWEQGDYDSPRPVSITTTNERNQKTGGEFTYGPAHNQVVESRGYGYGYVYQGGSNILLSKTVTQYHPGAGYASNHVFNLPIVVETYDGANARVARTEYQYDGATAPATPNGAASLAPLATGVTQHSDTHDPNAPQYMVEECVLWDNDQINCLQWNQRWTSNYQPGTDYRGNVTRVTSYASISPNAVAGAVTETRSYDITGNVVTTSTSCCELTRFTYTSATQYAYPTSQTRGSSDPNSPLRVTASVTYDFNTGLVLTNTDADGRVSRSTYEPATLRPHETTSPSDAVKSYSYDESAMSVTETTSLSGGGAVAAKSVKFLNGLGKVKREELLAAPEAQTWGASALDVVETKYDALGRVWKQSRPYRSGSEAAQFTTYTYDALGRVTRVESPDGGVSAAFFNDLDPSHPRPAAATSAPGETVLVVDPWGRERWSRTDSQGRLVEVVEPDADGGGGVAAGGYATAYGYDALGRLTDVLQGAQHRRFAYDGLGRLVRQKLAETAAVFDDAGVYVGVNGNGAAWSDVYAYDSRSNLVSRTDARNVKTSYSFKDAQNNDDPLNRLQSITYTVQTGTTAAADSVFYGYDTAGDLSRVTSITTRDPSGGQARTTEAYHYDAQKRADQKTVTLASRPGFSLVTNFSYDSLGRLIDVTYPAQWPSTTRKSVHHDYGVAGRLTGLTVGGAAYASQLDYNAAGQTKTLKVGAAGANQVTEEYAYDAATGFLKGQKAYRGSDGNANRLLDLSYDYLRQGSASGQTGQLTKITDRLNPERGRSFVYDALGRLKRVGGGDPSLAPMWAQDYTYDRYGNRTNVAASGNTAGLSSPAGPNVKAPDVELASNTDPEAPGFVRGDGGRTTTTDAPAPPMLSGAQAAALSAAFAPGAPTNLAVTSSSATQVNLSWSAPAGGADHYEVERGQSLLGTYTVVGTAPGNATAFSDTTVSGGSAYLYRVRAVDAGGNRSARSNAALGAAFTFADALIVAHVTPIRAQHVNELRQAVNAVRGVAGLGAATWTDPELTPRVTPVSAVHIQELRDRLNEALAALQISTPPFTDPVLATGPSGTPVRKSHVDELRERATRGASAGTGGGQGTPVPRDGFGALSYDAATNRINSYGWEYDAAGNQTRVQVATNVWQRYEYDAANRLVAVKTDAGVLITSYAYCYSTTRLVAQEGGTRTYYASSGAGVIAEYTETDGTPSAASPQWSKNYIYLGGRLLATQQPALGGERVEYHHPDRLGTRLVTNGTDATYYEQAALPFGTALGAETTGASNRRFTSYDRSPAAGLDYAVNRHYDPRQGRFTQADPAEMSAVELDNPQSLNLYSYCVNDPVNQLDPSGLGLISFFKKLLKGIGKVLTNKWVLLAAGIALAALGGYAFFLAATEPGIGTAALAAGIKLAALSAALITSAFIPGVQKAFMFASSVISLAQTALSVLNIGVPVTGTPGWDPEAAGGVGSVSSFLQNGNNRRRRRGSAQRTFGTLDAAAMAALSSINRRSRRENREFGGMLCRQADGSYIYTPPVRGTVDSVYPQDSPCPNGTTDAGAYHTHGRAGGDYLSEEFSDYSRGYDPDDPLTDGDVPYAFRNNFPFYVATPSRRVRVIDPALGVYEPYRASRTLPGRTP